MSDDPLPDDWEQLDLTAMYREYTRLCREEWLRGEAVAAWLRSAPSAFARGKP